LIPTIHYQHRLSLKLLVPHQSYHTIEELECSKTVMKLSFFPPPELYSIVMKLSSFVMSSRDVKLSSWVAELALLVAVMELAAIVVAMT
jgi:16S rRNA A1518/A1519 N6-dimethyltransferase RsmA/KsgA/DIM1 with predicted DNA glycosylase/AP lyase activity